MRPPFTEPTRLQFEVLANPTNSLFFGELGTGGDDIAVTVKARCPVSIGLRIWAIDMEPLDMTVNEDVEAAHRLYSGIVRKARK